ncbi:MAG: DUF4097 family beta strand repeat protein [Dehalococcoidia bacterium]|nr:DUF4097 family beta strand repeat protein [Dehalococcoidia bacterium]
MELVRSVSRQFVTGTESVLHLEARAGRVLVEGRPLDRVEVEAEVHVWSVSSDEADEAVRAVEAGMEQEVDGRVVVRAPALRETSGGWSLLKLAQRGTRVEYRVRVPMTSSVRVLSRSGRVEISGVHGRIHCEMISGRSQVRDIEGETTVVSRSGTVEVERIAGSVKLEARSGRVRLRDVRGAATVESRSGTIEVSRVTGELRVNGRTGSISVDAPGAAVHVRSRCGPVRYRGVVPGDVDIELHIGPIVFAVDTTAPIYIDAETRVGAVTSDLPPRRRGQPPATGGPKVRLRTQTGSIHLTRAD